MSSNGSAYVTHDELELILDARLARIEGILETIARRL